MTRIPKELNVRCSQLMETIITSNLSDDKPQRASRMAPEKRRLQVIKSALRIFAERGVGEASHTAIAQEAGVAVPTVFHYFGSKDEIVEAVLAEVSRFLLENLLGNYDKPDIPAPTALENLLLAFSNSIESDPDYVKVWLEWSVSIRGALWESYLRFYKGALAGIKRILRRGVKEGDVREDVNLDDGARVIVGIAHMVAQMKFSGASTEQVRRTVHSLVSGYLVR